jgi:hypothetical protein
MKTLILECTLGIGKRVTKKRQRRNFHRIMNIAKKVLGRKKFKLIYQVVNNDQSYIQRTLICENLPC